MLLGKWQPKDSSTGKEMVAAEVGNKLDSLFKSHISITHLQPHHAKKLAIYQACIIQPQLETSTSRGGE